MTRDDKNVNGSETVYEKPTVQKTKCTIFVRRLVRFLFNNLQSLIISRCYFTLVLLKQR